MKKHRLIAVLAAISFVFTAFGCKTDVEEKDTASPAEVTEFTVTASDGNAVLSWSEPKDADFRGVEISAEPAAGTLKRPVEVLKGTSSLEVTGLELNTEYTFKVRTFDFSLNYSRGTECKATVTNSEDSTPPAEVTEFTATAADGNALLSWTKPSDSDYAGVRISVTPAEGTLKNPVILGSEVTNLTVSGLKIGSEYTFKAETFDTSLNYSAGTEKAVTVSDTADYTAPAEVTNLTATAADGNAVLTWTNPADEDFAGVRVSVTPAEGTLKNPVILGGEVTNLTVSGFTIGSEYTFKVETFDTSLNYSAGTEKAVTVSDTADYTAPAEVTSLTATAADGNAVLTWTNPADEDFAGVRVSVTPAEGTLKNPVILGGEVTNLTVSGLKIGSEYTFKAETFDTSLNYSKGTEVKATVSDTADYTAPAEVTDFTATAADGNAVLTWTNPADEDFAGVRVSVTPAEGTLKNPVILGGEVTNLTVSGFTIGSEYTFKVETFDTSLNYSAGTEKAVTVSDTADYTAPAEVTSLTATAADGNAVLTWTNPADEDFAGVRISVTPAEGTLKNPVILGGEVTNLTVSGLKIGSEYTFKVETFDTSLNYSKGTEKAVTVSDTADYTAPAEVESLTAVNTDASVLLIWKDPSDSDLFGIEITYTAGTSSRAVSSMEEGSVFIAPKTESAKITGLTNGTAYTFTVKTMDLSGNKSVGVTKTVTPAIIEKSPLQITLTPDTTAKTNGDVTVAVSAVTDSASAVKKIAYKAGTLANVSEVLNGKDITEAKTFTVEENASFTVAAQDTAGRRELTWITVSNIDKTAPAAVTALEIGYDYGKKTVTISWKDPADSDFANAEVTYTLGDKDAVTVPVAKGKQTYVIENIEPDVKVTASVKAVDDVNNESTAVNAEITTTMSFAIRSITLSRDHVEYKSGKQITATIKGDNFNLLPSEEKEEALTVKVYDGNTLVTSCTTVAEVDTVNNTATATFTAPDGTDSITGKTYTVEAVVNVEKTGVNTPLRVSSTPSINSFSIYDENGKKVSAISVSDVTAETTIKATVEAYNFDIANEIKLAFFDAAGKEVAGASKIVTEEDYDFKNTTSYETFSVNVPVPQNEGVYTLKAVWDGTVISSSYYKTLQIYGVPKFTSFKIPNAGTSAKGNQLTATFKGVNFTAPDVDASLFTVSCDTKKAIVADSSVTVTNDTTATVLLTIPDTAGTYTVTLSYGSSSIPADFVVKDTSTYSVGDVMLSDGTKVDYVESQTFTEEQKAKAVAVIFGFRNGVPLGVGLNNSKSGTNSGSKVWAPSGTTGYNTKFTEIICTPSVTGSGAASTATFTGDTNGSDNWDYICSVDPEGTKAPAANYPAFNYVLEYASTFSLPEEYKDGWYMPSIAELAELYKNKEIVNGVLSAVGGTQIYSGYYYWSSSQYSSSYDYAWKLDFSDGTLINFYKGSNGYVCCVRAF